MTYAHSLSSEVEGAAVLAIQASRSALRYRIALPIRTKSGPPPSRRRFARVEGELRRYSAASLGVIYVLEAIYVSLHLMPDRTGHLDVMPNRTGHRRNTRALRRVSEDVHQIQRSASEPAFTRASTDLFSSRHRSINRSAKLCLYRFSAAILTRLSARSRPP